MRHRDHLGGRRHRAERVGDVRQRHQPRARVQQLLVLVEQHLPVVVDRRDADLRALLGGQQLPRHDVRVVLEPGEHDLVVFADVAPAPALRDQVHAFGRAADEDDVLDGAGVEEGLHLLSRRLVGVGRTGGQGVRRAVDVRVLFLVEARDAVDHALRLLRGRGVVEPHQRPSIHGLLQDREVASHGLGLEHPPAGAQIRDDVGREGLPVGIGRHGRRRARERRRIEEVERRGRRHRGHGRNRGHRGRHAGHRCRACRHRTRPGHRREERIGHPGDGIGVRRPRHPVGAVTCTHGSGRLRRSRARPAHRR